MIAELPELSLGEVSQKAGSDPGPMSCGSFSEPLGARVRESSVVAARVFIRSDALDQLAAFKPVDEAAAAARRQQRGVGELGHPQSAVGRVVQEQQDLVGGKR